MQETCTAPRGTQRQQHLVPYDATIETPRVVARHAQWHSFDVRRRERIEQATRVCAYSRGGADGLLRIDCDFERWKPS